MLSTKPALRRHLLPLLTAITLPLLSGGAIAANDAVLGQWDTINKNGEPQSLVELYRNGDELNGRIIKLYDETRQDAVCTKCKGDLHNKPIAGMVIITGLEADDDQWKGGRVVDPETGNEYDCKLWLDGDTLKIKAGFGFIGQTREWQRPAQ